MTGTETPTKTAPRLKTRYDDTVKGALKDQLGLANVMQVPRLVKIVVNMGVGKPPAAVVPRAPFSTDDDLGSTPMSRSQDSHRVVQAAHGKSIVCRHPARLSCLEFLRLITSRSAHRDFRGLPATSWAAWQHRFGLTTRRCSRRSTPTRSTRARA